MADFGEIMGGLMTGVGGAMQQRGRAEREAALKRLEMEHGSQLRSEEDRRKHGYQTEENEQRGRIDSDRVTQTYGLMDQNSANDAGRRHTNSMAEIGARGAQDRSNASHSDALNDDDVVKTQILDDGTTVGVTRNGKTVELKDPKGNPIKGTPELSAADDRLIKKYERRHTDEDTGRIDEAAVEKDLRGAGKGREADLYLGVSPGKSGAGAGGGGGGSQKAQPVPVPDRMAKEPDGTTVRKGGQLYVKRGNQLIPQ